jgi:hypothetical protein
LSISAWEYLKVTLRVAGYRSLAVNQIPRQVRRPCTHKTIGTLPSDLCRLI